MATPDFKYQPMFEHGKDTTEYYLLTKDYVSVSEFEGKPLLTVTMSEDQVKAGLNAGQLVREAAKLIQGGGGGQPHFATAGGKNPEGLSQAVDKVIELAGF